MDEPLARPAKGTCRSVPAMKISVHLLLPGLMRGTGQGTGARVSLLFAPALGRASIVLAPRDTDSVDKVPAEVAALECRTVLPV